jgi:hypothetical protein
MKKILINFADEVFKSSQTKNSETGKEIGGFDSVISYSPHDIDEDFSNKNRETLSQKRGAGYWLWKPYFIVKTLTSMQDDDYLFYCDSGAYFIQSIDPLIKLSQEKNQDIICFNVEHIQKDWTKRDTFILMNCDESKFLETKQILAGFILVKKSKFSIDFFDEFLEYAQDPRILTDLDNQLGKPNYNTFQEHRHDQSIFSLLCKRHNIAAYRDPSQYGNDFKEYYPTSTYPQILELTRKKDIENKISFFKALERKLRHAIRSYTKQKTPK